MNGMFWPYFTPFSTCFPNTMKVAAKIPRSLSLTVVVEAGLSAAKYNVTGLALFFGIVMLFAPESLFASKL